MTPRINSAPRFIALIPSVRVFFLIHTCHLSTTQKETYDEDNAQKQPGGFFVILLPYADDIRKISIKSEHHPAAAEQVVVCSEYQYFFFFFFHPSPFSVITYKQHQQQAKRMVRSLRLQFDSRDFENPGMMVISLLCC